MGIIMRLEILLCATVALLLVLPLRINCAQDAPASNNTQVNLDFAIKVGEVRSSLGIHFSVGALPIDRTICSSIPPGIPFCIAYDSESDTVYWAPEGDLFAKSVKNNATNVQLIAEGLINLGGIAVDGVTGNIYFVDWKQSLIAVCSRSTSNSCSVIIQYEQDKPFIQSLALDVNHGAMFWTQIAPGNQASIMRAGLDGSQISAIVSQDLMEPNGITVDLSESLVYWKDMKRNVIESSRIDGNDRKVLVYLNASNPQFTHVFRTSLYWGLNQELDENAKKLMTMNLQNDGTKIEVLGSNIGKFQGVFRFDLANKFLKRPNPCESAGCSHICTLSPNSYYQCLCPAGMKLSNDSLSCFEPFNSPKLVIGYNNTLKMMRIETIGTEMFETVTLSESVVKSIGDIAYNPVTNSLLFSDSSTKKIFEYQLSTKRLKTLVDRDIDSVLAVDVDPVGQNLYWVDSGKKTLEVMSLVTGARVVLSPYSGAVSDILIVPERRQLLTAGMLDGNGTIRRRNLNGRPQYYTKWASNIAPVALAFDVVTKNMLWYDNYSKSIMLTLYQGGREESVKVLGYDLFDVVYFKDRIYWSDMSSQYVNVRKLGTNRRIKISDLPVLPAQSEQTGISFKMAIINRDTSHISDLLAKHACSPRNKAYKRCSHICVMDSGGYVGVCLCPDGMTLDKSGWSCTRCNPLEFTCEGDGTCLEKNRTCNGLYDCKDRSDESNCRSRPCALGAVKCKQEGSCIQSSFVCNGIQNCRDGSDERNCSFFKSVENAEEFIDTGNDTNILLFGVAGVLSLAILRIVIVIYYSIRLRRNKQIISDSEVNEFREGRPSNETLIDKDHHIFAEKYNENLYEVDKFEFSQETSEIIGQGNFGVVYKSFMLRYNSEVAVKVPKSTDSDKLGDEVRSVMSEIKVMSYLGEHPNVVTLLGAVTKEIEKGVVLVITELCENGSLLNYLRSIQTDDVNQLVMYKLYGFCLDISSGMEYLAEKKVIHGDLSCRNVLLDKNMTCKISDFGLSRKIENYATYIKKSKEPLPWAWLSVESLARLEFTLKSDVWSIGVTFFEVFSLGTPPYLGETFNIEFVEKLKNGFRLKKPQLASDRLFAIMEACWSLEPISRPEPKDLTRFFQSQRCCVYELLNGSIQDDITYHQSEN